MRYHVFWGDTYYPGRALRDYVASFDTEEEARHSLVGVSGPDWWSIVAEVDGRLRELDMGEFPFLVDE
jgi:hypothetical protein